MPALDASQGDTAPVPLRQLSSRQVGEMALQKIGAFSVNDDGADPNELERALEWMETGIGHLSGVHRLQWLIPTTIEFDLEDDVAEYVLADVMGANYPALGIAYPIAAYRGTFTGTIRGAWRTATAYVSDDRVSYGGHEYIIGTAHTSGTFATDLAAGRWVLQPAVQFNEIAIVRRAEYEAHRWLETPGVTDFIYIDRLNDNKNLFVYPVQHSSVNVRIRLVLQTYPRSVRGQSAEDTAGDVPTGFPVEWNLWLIHMTAAAIGDGPVRRLDAQTLKGYQVIAGQALLELMGGQNREKITHRRHRTRTWGA